MAYIFIFSIVIPFVLIVVAVPGLRRRSVRGFQTAIELDGAICLKASDGSVAFRPKGGGLLYLAALESVLLFFAGLVGMLNGYGQAGMLPVLVGLLIGCLLVGIAIASIVRSLSRSYLYFDANSRVLETTRPTTQQIPADDGRVEIRRHSRQYYWFVIIFLGTVEFGLLALLVRLGPGLLCASPFLLAIVAIGLALLSAARSLRTPSIDISANPRTSKRKGLQQVPFSEIVDISTVPRMKSQLDEWGEKLIGVLDWIQDLTFSANASSSTYIDIWVNLSAGEMIWLGSASGQREDLVHQRATAISHLVAEVTGAAMRLVVRKNVLPYVSRDGSEERTQTQEIIQEDKISAEEGAKLVQAFSAGKPDKQSASALRTAFSILASIIVIVFGGGVCILIGAIGVLGGGGFLGWALVLLGFGFIAVGAGNIIKIAITSRRRHMSAAQHDNVADASAMS